MANKPPLNGKKSHTSVKADDDLNCDWIINNLPTLVNSVHCCYETKHVQL